MKRFFVFITFLTVAAFLASACGDKLPPPGTIQLGPSITLGALPTADNHDGDAFTFTATITGSGSISWSWDFGGGAVPTDGASGSGGGTISVPTRLVNTSLTEDRSYNGSVTATDQFGSRTATFTYVVGRRLNQSPVIESATFADGLITVVASDPDGDPLTYSYEVISGNVTVTLIGDGSTASVTTSALSTDFTVRVTVSDGKGGTATADVSGSISIPIPDNAIWMIFDKPTTFDGYNTTVSANVGDEITVTVYAYNIANELSAIVPVHIQFTGDILNYVGDPDGLGPATASFEVGEPNGQDWALDGIWTEVGGIGGFLPGPTAEDLFGPYDVDYTVDGQDFPGMKYFEFAIATYAASETTPITPAPPGSSGALFSFKFTAASAGTATVRFIQNRDNSATPVTQYSHGASVFLFDDQQVVTINVS